MLAAAEREASRRPGDEEAGEEERATAGSEDCRQRLVAIDADAIFLAAPPRDGGAVGVVEEGSVLLAKALMVVTKGRERGDDERASPSRSLERERANGGESFFFFVGLDRLFFQDFCFLRVFFCSFCTPASGNSPPSLSLLAHAHSGETNTRLNK